MKQTAHLVVIAQHSFATNIKWTKFKQRTLTYFVRGNITVQLTYCLTGFDQLFS